MEWPGQLVPADEEEKEQWPGQLAPPENSFTAKATGYFPVDPGSPHYQMEGGRVGAGEWHGKKLAAQEPLYTLDQYRRNQAPYVSVAMDNSRANPLEYGSFLESPQFPGVPFRVMDTGSAFNGRSNKYGGPKGLGRIDIARDDASGANSRENNASITFTPTPPPNREIGGADPGSVWPGTLADEITAKFDTALPPEEEQRFQKWKEMVAPKDSGEDYDFRGAFKEGINKGPDGHWPDTYKKPNHPTFSDESIYAMAAPQKAGHWDGDTFVPPKPEASIPHIIANAARNVPAGAGSGAADAAAGLLKVGADLNEWSGNRLSGAVRSVTGLDPAQLNQDATDYLRRRSKEIPAEQGIDPSLANTLPAQIGSGFGSLIPAVASSYAAPVTIAGMMGEQGRKEAEAAGGTEAQQDTSFYTNAAVGAVSEYLLGVPALIRSAKAAGIADDVYKSIARRAAEQAAKGAVRESTQEGIQQTASNLVASTIAGYDKDRDIFENVPTSMLIGGLVGGPVGAASISLTPTTPEGGEQQNATTQDSIPQERARIEAEGIQPGQQPGEATSAPATPYGAGQEGYAFDPRGSEGYARFQVDQPKADIFEQISEETAVEGRGPAVTSLDLPAEPLRTGPDSGLTGRPIEDQRQNGPRPGQYGPIQDAGQTNAEGSGSELTPQGPLTFQPFAALPAAGPSTTPPPTTRTFRLGDGSVMQVRPIKNKYGRDVFIVEDTRYPGLPSQVNSMEDAESSVRSAARTRRTSFTEDAARKAETIPALLQARKIPELRGKMIPDGEERVLIEGTEAVIPKERAADAAWGEAHNRKSLLEALRDCLAKAA